MVKHHKLQKYSQLVKSMMEVHGPHHVPQAFRGGDGSTAMEQLTGRSRVLNPMASPWSVEVLLLQNGYYSWWLTP